MKNLYLLFLLALLASNQAFAADFELKNQSGVKNPSWINPESWILKSGESKTGFPGMDDTVFLAPNGTNSNFGFFIKSPASASNTIEIESFDANLRASNSFFGVSYEPQLFVVKNDFNKSAETSKDDKGNVVGAKGARGDLAFAPLNAAFKFGLRIGGNANLRDEATDRTSNAVFGGSTYYGSFRDALLTEFVVGKDMNISNNIVYIGTINGENAAVLGNINFEPPVNGRHAVLIVNGDDSDKVRHKSQTLKVGGLESKSDSSGVISTLTKSQRIADIDPLSKEGEHATSAQLMQKKKIGDTVERVGIIEIVGKGGNFSGEIRDNFRDGDKRGKIAIIMNSADGRQVLSGKNTYTGYTIIKAGTLAVNSLVPLENVMLQGGRLDILSDSPVIRNLNWSAGGFSFNLAKFSPIAVEGSLSVSTMPEALDTLSFSNITPRKAYTLFTFKNKKDAFANFAGKKVDYKDESTGISYEGVFGVSDSALTVVFVQK